VLNFRKPDDWTLSWNTSGVIYGWGHNHRGQLGGVEGAKVKLPSVCESLSTLNPLQIAGGEQTLFSVTAEGHVYATGLNVSLIFELFLIYLSCRLRSWWKIRHRQH
jgi:alpha-tubulin suppressor-like RCC1 family protein